MRGSFIQQYTLWNEKGKKKRSKRKEGDANATPLHIACSRGGKEGGRGKKAEKKKGKKKISALLNARVGSDRIGPFGAVQRKEEGEKKKKKNEETDQPFSSACSPRQQGEGKKKKVLKKKGRKGGGNAKPFGNKATGEGRGGKEGGKKRS